MSGDSGVKWARTAIGFAIALVIISVLFRGRTPAPGLPPVDTMPEWLPQFMAVMAMIGLAAWLLMPLVRAWARRIEGRSVDMHTQDELAELRERIAELDLTNARVQELEERLDFAERLLAQRNDAPQMPLHRTPV